MLPESTRRRHPRRPTRGWQAPTAAAAVLADRTRLCIGRFVITSAVAWATHARSYRPRACSTAGCAYAPRMRRDAERRPNAVLANSAQGRQSHRRRQSAPSPMKRGRLYVLRGRRPRPLLQGQVPPDRTRSAAGEAARPTLRGSAFARRTHAAAPGTTSPNLERPVCRGRTIASILGLPRHGRALRRRLDRASRRWLRERYGTTRSLLARRRATPVGVGSGQRCWTTGADYVRRESFPAASLLVIDGSLRY